MDAVNILEHAASVKWEDDDEPAVHYLSVGEPRFAVGIDTDDRPRPC